LFLPRLPSGKPTEKEIEMKAGKEKRKTDRKELSFYFLAS
jgi:hypothetical protein